MKQTNALRDLIDDTATRNGWTLADIATRAQRAGHDLSPQNISRIKKGPTVNLVAKQVRALAAGLGVPVGVVIDANLRAMGFDVERSGEVSARDAIERDPGLTERDRRLLLAVLQEATQPAIWPPEVDPRTRARDVPVIRAAAPARELPVEQWAARKGTPGGGPDLTSGEESQDPGSDEPA